MHMEDVAVSPELGPRKLPSLRLLAASGREDSYPSISTNTPDHGNDVARKTTIESNATSTVNEELRLLTFNLGLLRFRLCCCTVVESPPFVEDRIGPICEALADSDAHIIAVQEIYENRHVVMLLDAVEERFPYHVRYDNQKCWQFHSGLLFLSRFPITASNVLKHSRSTRWEQVLGCKSCLTMQVDTPLGGLCLANIHTTAGGLADPESVEADVARQCELEEAIHICQRAMYDGCKAIILGDFNCGPQASVGNYDFMTRDYIDAVLPFGEGMITWDCNNPLNSFPVFVRCPAQRIDHFFIHKDAGLKASSAKLMFTDATVQVRERRGQKMLPLSDHYGVQISIIACEQMLSGDLECSSSLSSLS